MLVHHIDSLIVEVIIFLIFTLVFGIVVALGVLLAQSRKIQNLFIFLIRIALIDVDIFLLVDFPTFVERTFVRLSALHSLMASRKSRIPKI